MGTAIDEMLDDQIRVTVVATGLGAAGVPVEPKTPTLVKPDGELDIEELNKPTVIRQKEQQQQTIDEYDEELLDIPAFLRRQAD